MAAFINCYELPSGQQLELAWSKREFTSLILQLNADHCLGKWKAGRTGTFSSGCILCDLGKHLDSPAPVVAVSGRRPHSTAPIQTWPELSRAPALSASPSQMPNAPGARQAILPCCSLSPRRRTATPAAPFAPSLTRRDKMRNPTAVSIKTMDSAYCCSFDYRNVTSSLIKLLFITKYC